MIVNDLISFLNKFKIWAEWNLSVIIHDYLIILIALSHLGSLTVALDLFAVTLITSNTFKRVHR